MAKRKVTISKLQFITQKKDELSILEEVKSFLNGGGDWVQLRMKDATHKEFMQVAQKVKTLCKAYNATFIINDNVDIAIEVGADGIHLGKGDLPTSVVRPLVGDKMIIGRTANTSRDIEIISKQQIDYIGLGPYKWTDTKKNIAEVLGLEGYERVFSDLREKNIVFQPIVAIGSVCKDDIEPLSKIKGIYGIAVSGAISNAENSTTATMQIIENLDKWMF